MCLSRQFRNELCAISIMILGVVIVLGAISYSSQVNSLDPEGINPICASTAVGNKNSLRNELFSELSATGEHKLLLKDFSHYNRPIYVNYTQIDFTLELHSESSSGSHVFIYSSSDKNNWSSPVELSKTEQVSTSIALFEGQVGPFSTVGTLYLKANATYGGEELAAIYTRVTVERIVGLVFVDFDYSPKTISWDNPNIYVYVTVFGDDLDNYSVRVTHDQQTRNETPIKMNLWESTSRTFRGTIGPLTEGGINIHVNFTAKTNTGKQYGNTNFFIPIGEAPHKEDFLTETLPAIIVGVVVMGAITTIYIMRRGRSPKSYE